MPFHLRMVLTGCSFREPDGKGGAIADDAKDGDRAAMQLYELFDDGESQTCSFGSRKTRATLTECIENKRERLRGNPRTRVGYRDLDPAIIGSRGNCDAPFIGKFDRVVDQIDQHLIEARGIGQDHETGLTFDCDLQFDTLFCCPGSESVHSLVSRLIHVDGSNLERQTSDFHSSQIKEVVHKTSEPTCNSVSDFQELSLVVREFSARVRGRHFDVTLDCRERGAQFMGRHGHSLVLARSAS